MLTGAVGVTARWEPGSPNMIATTAPPSTALDTGIPGLTRRRVWSAPAVLSHSLLALTFQKLHLAPAGANVRPDAIAAIQTGADLEQTFGPFGTIVELAKVSRVLFDLLANTLTLEYPQGEGSGTIRLQGHALKARVVIEFADHETADEVYTKIWRRLGDRVELKPYRRDFRDLGRVPVALMIGVLFATVLLVAAIQVAAEAGPSANPVFAALNGFDWRWVCGVGGAALAVLQVRVYRAFTQPPTHLELAARFSTEQI